MIAPDSTGLYHPKDEGDIIGLIQHALQNKLQVRVRGAAQSATGAVFADGGMGSNNTDGNINIELDQMRQITIDAGTKQVTVGGGCNLGTDPFDPSGMSEASDVNNLFFVLNQNGLAIPNVSGAIHQTVAGFISTGSSGGSMQHSFDECILSIRMIDGTGTVQTFTKSGNLDDEFYGAAVSMGLLGIITAIKLQCVPAFNIIGQEATTSVADCEFSLLDAGNENKPSIAAFLSHTEFSRVLWWPIKTLQRCISWKARTMEANDYKPDVTGTSTAFQPKPYKPIFPSIFGSTLPSEAIAATGFKFIATWPTWMYTFLGIDAAEATAAEKITLDVIDEVAPYLYPFFTDFYFPCNSPTKPAQQFWDNWLGSLPMDKVEFSNNLFDLQYSEMWFPVATAAAAISTMAEYYTANGYSATGFYTVELLAAKKSDFWLSPAYGTDVVRVNIMYFRASTLKAEDYYNQFWDLFKQNNIDFRPHWGKYLPLPSSSTGPAYLESQYPKWQAFMALRKKMDPDNIFLNSYWKTQLGIG